MNNPCPFRPHAAFPCAFALFVLLPAPAFAQRAGENAVMAASDAFGVAVGDERIGVYAPDNVRGFSPITAGNRRLEGLYIDTTSIALTNRLVSGSTIRVGLAALSYPFPAPSGIVDYTLRPAGDNFIASVVAGRPSYGGAYVEVDAQMPIVPGSVSIGAGAGYTKNEYSDGRSTHEHIIAVVPRIRFAGGALTPFWTYSNYGGDTGALIVTGGPYLPPRFKPGNFKSQDWTDRLQTTHSYGAIGHLDIASNWRLSAGLFETRSTRERTFIDMFLDTKPDGTARNVVISEPSLPARWTSGEAKLTWTPQGKSFAHRIELSARGRDRLIEQGGGVSALLGPARIGVPNPAEKPDFVFGPTTLNAVKQWSAGLSYIGRWQRFAELNVGIQKTHYRQKLERINTSDSTRADELLYSATLALQPTDWLAIYGGHTVGLEETAAPPQSAVNRDDAPPASKTRQWDAGVRLALGETRIVAGVFQTARPYFATDAANFYTQLGERRNRGVEFSVVARPVPGLRVVGGLIYYDAKVLGPAVTLGRTGPRPLNSTPINARLDLDYAVPGIAGLSFQGTITHSGPTIASTQVYQELDGKQLRVPEVTTVDLGVRYRWKVGEVPVALRLNLQDITDERTLRVSGSNTFFLNSSRRFNLQLSADF